MHTRLYIAPPYIIGTTLEPLKRFTWTRSVVGRNILAPTSVFSEGGDGAHAHKQLVEHEKTPSSQQ